MGGRRYLRRNIAVALGNSGNGQAVACLEIAARDEDVLVRQHAEWALARLGNWPVPELSLFSMKALMAGCSGRRLSSLKNPLCKSGWITLGRLPISVRQRCHSTSSIIS